jgi:hypothetical protein
MNTDLIKNGRKWSLHGAVLAGMIYSAVTLNSAPAYAGGDVCTAQECFAACGTVICPIYHLMWTGRDTCNSPANGSVVCLCEDSGGGLEYRGGPCS